MRPLWHSLMVGLCSLQVIRDAYTKPQTCPIAHYHAWLYGRLQVEDGIPTICLYAEPGVVGLYEKLGYVKDPEGIKGMAFQRKKKDKQKLLAKA